MAQPLRRGERDADPFMVSDFTRWATLAEQLCQDEVRRRISADLETGLPVYSASIGDDAGKTYMRLPDERRFRIRVVENGAIEIIRQVA